MPDQTQLDPQVVNLAKAIRQTESGGNFTVRGKSGEYGAYQYTPETWKQDSQKYGVNVDLEQATPEQQNEVAYKKIKELKDAGHNVGQIASIWNSGKPEWEGNVGVNKHGVKFDTPKYVDSVANTYQQYKQGNQNPTIQPNPSTVQQKTPEQPITSKLAERAGTGAQALSDTATGQINPFSGLLQTFGAGAGAVNDVVQKGLEYIPGVKQVEGLIGKWVGALANTGVGKSVVSGAQDFATKHPEAAGNIGAIGNILGTAGLLTGAGEIKSAVGGAVAKGLGKSAVADIVADITPNLTGKGLVSAVAKKGTEKSLLGTINLASNPALEETGTVIKELIPKFSKLGTYAEKTNAVDDSIGTLAQTLRTNLSKGEIKPILTPDDLMTIENGMKAEIQKNPLLVGQAGEQAQRIYNVFKDYLPKTGDITMTDILDARQNLDNYISSIKPKAFDPVTENSFSTALRAVRQGANNLMEAKVPEAGVKTLLRKQSLLYDARDVLAQNAVKAKEIGSTAMSRFVGRHPIATKIAKKTGEVAGIGLLGAGTYGAYKGITGE